MSGKSTGENFEVDIKNWQEADAIHLWRYYNARGFIEKDDEVIDLGCGYGYGTAILSRSLATGVIGYDYDKRVLNKKAKIYLNSKITFIKKDIEKEEIPECDYVVCIEVLEHMENIKAIINKMKVSARRIIFLSVPIVPGTNKFHKEDFTAQQIEGMFIDDEWGILRWANLGGTNGLFLFYRKSWLQS